MRTLRGQPSLSLGLGVPDRPIEKTGQIRAFSGEVMEEVIVSLFGLAPGITNGAAAVCPDAFAPDDRPVEIKSLKRGQKLVVYDWRAAKDFDDCLYFIGVHNRKKTQTVAEIWTGLAATMKQVLIIPAIVIKELALREPLHRIKSDRTASGNRNGYQRAGYKEGYRSIPYASLLALVSPMPFRIQAALHGLSFAVQPCVCLEPGNQ